MFCSTALLTFALLALLLCLTCRWIMVATFPAHVKVVQGINLSGITDIYDLVQECNYNHVIIKLCNGPKYRI